jgi:diguanylate cyclase/phosphodiesterase with PAS/PAC sensor(s)
VGRWVLNEACRRQHQLQGLAAQGCKVALNVSTQQLMLGDFVGEVRDALAVSGADPARLELEITESALMADPGKAEATLRQLKQLGLGIVIDDFGTGYSSLGYLHRFPVDKLKIDRSFVSDVLTDRDDALICASIIQLAHNLGLSVVAEGVETEAQWRWLAARGCEQMQGYHFARPVPFADAQADD